MITARMIKEVNAVDSNINMEVLESFLGSILGAMM
jgi:hypothetical protein